MLKASLLALTCTLALAISTAPFSIARAQSPDDVFLDEGDGDFGSIPIPGTETTSNPEPPSSFSDDSLIAEPSASESSSDSNDYEAPKAKPSKKVKIAKQPAPAPVRKTVKNSGGGRFMTTKDSCQMRREPASEGETMITVKPYKKIWVEEVDQGWVRGFNKAGEPGYLNRDCFQ